MNYGLENIVLTPPYSLFVSIILFFGTLSIGDFFQIYILKKSKNYTYGEYSIYLSPLIGAYLIIFPLYLILIFEFYGIFFLKLFSYSLFFLGLINLYSKKNLYLNIIKKFKLKQSYLVHLIILLYGFLFLVSASPITHADSIDYHFLGAQNLLNFGHFYKEILPMHLNLASLGEILISIGLVMRAEQFGGIIQFSSLLALIPIFFRKKQFRLFLVFILACPITFVLASSPKPQLLFSISALLIFIFLNEEFSRLKKKEINLYFFLGILTLAVASLAKFSFILSSAILFLYAFSILLKKKLLISSILISFLVFGISFLPMWIFRYQNFGTEFPTLFLSSLPLNVYGYQNFNNLLSGSDGSRDILSLFLFEKLEDFSTTYGPLLFLLILMINKKTMEYRFPITMIMIFILSVFIFGSNSNRFLYEGFLWLTYLVGLTYSNKTIVYKIFSKLIYIQAAMYLFIVIFFISTIFPGSLSEKFKKNMMKNHANGYELANWANSKIDNNDILLVVNQRSLALYNAEVYSDIFTWYVDLENKKSEIYTDFLKSKKINKIIIYGYELNTNPFYNCLGKEISYKKNVGRNVGRNPIRKGRYKDGWIFEFNYQELPNCLVR